MQLREVNYRTLDYFPLKKPVYEEIYDIAYYRIARAIIALDILINDTCGVVLFLNMHIVSQFYLIIFKMSAYSRYSYQF